jgi:hypothetical protein
MFSWSNLAPKRGEQSVTVRSNKDKSSVFYDKYPKKGNRMPPVSHFHEVQLEK